MSAPAISIIMPCYNRAHDLQRALQAYDEQIVDQPFELIAVDDASTDSTYALLSSYHPFHYALHVERLEVNQGPAAARNRGLSLAAAPLVMFTGDDILPHPDLVRGHLAAHRRYRAREMAVLGRVEWPGDAPVNTLMTHIDGVGQEQFSYYYLRDGQEYDFRHLYTANISLKRDFLVSQEKWFDTDFPYAAFEDVELAYRLSKQGLRIVYSSILLGYHYHYHNVWTFSTRQYRSGLMACVLVKKHPEMAHHVMGKSWPYRTLYWRLLSSLRNYPAESAAWLEAETLHLLNALEWSSHKLLDPLYLKALNYFYYKGLIFGTFGEGSVLAKRVHGVYAHRILLPLLAWFFRESQRVGEPIPDDHGEWVLNSLSRFGVRVPGFSA
jgi:glycosyltransferase involved in cell wall biosynthesis